MFDFNSFLTKVTDLELFPLFTEKNLDPRSSDAIFHVVFI